MKKTEIALAAAGGHFERPVGPRALLLAHKDGRETLHPMSEYAVAYRDTAVGEELLYDAATVRYMLEGAWCAGYYDAGYTNDGGYACKMAEKCADEFLRPNTERSGAERPAGAASSVAD
jgi:hypothetical protein